MMQTRKKTSVRIAAAVSLFAGPVVAASSAVSDPVALSVAPLQAASAPLATALQVRSTADYATGGTSFSSAPSGDAMIIR